MNNEYEIIKKYEANIDELKSNRTKSTWFLTGSTFLLLSSMNIASYFVKIRSIKQLIAISIIGSSLGVSITSLKDIMHDTVHIKSKEKYLNELKDKELKLKLEKKSNEN